MKYIKAIEDSKMWKDQYEDIAKGTSKMEDGYYVLNNQTGIGGSTQYIPTVAQDVMMAKAKIRKYKKKPKRLNRQSKAKQNRRRTPRRKRRSKTRISKKKRKGSKR